MTTTLSVAYSKKSKRFAIMLDDVVPVYANIFINMGIDKSGYVLTIDELLNLVTHLRCERLKLTVLTSEPRIIMALGFTKGKQFFEKHNIVLSCTLSNIRVNADRLADDGGMYLIEDFYNLRNRVLTPPKILAKDETFEILYTRYKFRNTPRAKAIQTLLNAGKDYEYICTVFCMDTRSLMGVLGLW